MAKEMRVGRELGTWMEMILTFHRIQRRMQAATTAHGLTLPQFEVLYILNQAAGITQQELAERLLVSKGNVCGLIDRLTQSGYLQRHTDTCDRRINRLHLTPAGTAIIEGAIPDHHAILTEMFGVLAPDELETLRKMLHRISRGHRVLLATGSLAGHDDCPGGS